MSPLSASVQASVIVTAVLTFVFFARSWQTGAFVTLSVMVAVAPVTVPSVAR